MNRTIAMFLAMAILLAHTLAIHVDADGNFAYPYDLPHVAYRLARNFVHHGSFSWDPLLAASESYPSPLWVGVAAVAEQLYKPVTLFCQTIGIASAMATVVVLAGFSTGRLAGVVAPLLLVVSGAIAAAAGSGTEIPLLALLVTAGFLAYERRRPWLMGLAWGFACLTRPEAMWIGLALLLIELVRRARGTGEEPPVLRGFAIPIVLLAGMSAVRFSLTGELLAPATEGLFTLEREEFVRGGRYLLDFFLASGGPLLVAFPAWYALRHALGGMGTRALVLTIVWCAVVGISGGGTLPMGIDMAPILPVLYVSVQEAVTVAIDSRRRWLTPVVWALFVLGLTTSAISSKYPGDLGPLPTERVLRALMEPFASPRFGYAGRKGRLGVTEEIDMTGRLRSVGIFMRDHLDPSHTVLTPWPGAVGYLSRLRVIDALGRTSPLPGQDRVSMWTGVSRADVAMALELEPDYIVPQVQFTELAPTEQVIAASWIKELDILHKLPKRKLDVRKQLLTYELIAVPIDDRPSQPGGEFTRPFYLMRKRSLGLAPTLSVSFDGREFAIDVQHRSHEQLVDLRVTASDAQGRRWTMRPTGAWEAGAPVLARSRILLFPTGTRRIRLARGSLEGLTDPVELRVVLRNPGARGDRGFALASEELSVSVE